jgi:putative ABC transport system substrate-binding protein
MTDLGYVEGQQYTVEARYAENNLERLPDLAAELVRLSPDVIVAAATPAIAALKTATGTIPIVMVGSTSPVEAGFVASLARPGGNVTGLATLSSELDQKRLQLFKETVPGLARVGVLWNPDNTGEADESRLAEEAARALGLELRSLEVRDPGALEAAFERVSAERVDGLVLIENSILAADAPRIAEFALRHRLPTMSGNRITVGAGGLMAYGADRPAMFRRAAGFVERILKGANPAEMPIERPTAFDLVLNLKTARELGLTIPPSVLQQATELIQ